MRLIRQTLIVSNKAVQKSRIRAVACARLASRPNIYKQNVYTPTACFSDHHRSWSVLIFIALNM